MANLVFHNLYKCYEVGVLANLMGTVCRSAMHFVGGTFADSSGKNDQELMTESLITTTNLFLNLFPWVPPVKK